jgi:hypothetical protein
MPQEGGSLMDSLVKSADRVVIVLSAIADMPGGAFIYRSVK